MTDVDEQSLPAAGVPDAHSLIVACGGEVLAIRGLSHAGHNVDIAPVGEQSVPVAGVPPGVCVRFLQVEQKDGRISSAGN